MKKCTYEGCNKSFSCNSKLTDHLNSHLGIRPFRCEICNIGFFSKRYLSTHNEIHKETDYICNKCNFKFNRKSNYVRHLKNCSKITDKTIYKCEFCNKIYKVKGFFLYHIHEKHSNDVDEKLLKDIQIQYRNLDHKCDQCNKCYTKAANLQNHIRTIHNKERVSCQFCNETFSYKKSLKKHLQNVHPDQKNI